MNQHQKSLLGEISALGTVFLTISLFVISLPLIFLSTKPMQPDKQEYVEASISS